MREIKFRGQRVDNKEWVYGYYYMYPINKNPVNDHHYIINFEWSDLVAGYSDLRFEVIPETVGQYIGENDKNGNPIFEGDICPQIFYHNNPPSKRPKMKSITVNLAVIFSDGKFHLDEKDMRMSEYGTTYNFRWSNCEIIGNIHSNPSLLTTHP